jgi:Amt family ammonium transporter
MMNPSKRVRRFLFLAGLCIVVFGTARFAFAQSGPDLAPADPVAERLAEQGREINFIWTLIAGFLVMFMQAGFALIETGMCRAKNAAHTMSMNFLVYAVGMIGFWVCGYAFLCGGVNGVPGGAGGPATLGLSHVRELSNMRMLTIGDHQWGLIGFSGFFLLGKIHLSAGAMVWFFYMMVFMDTAATIPTGTLAERWRFKNFAVFSLCVAMFIYPIYACWMWGGGWLSQMGGRLISQARPWCIFRAECWR